MYRLQYHRKAPARLHEIAQLEKEMVEVNREVKQMQMELKVLRNPFHVAIASAGVLRLPVRREEEAQSTNKDSGHPDLSRKQVEQQVLASTPGDGSVATTDDLQGKEERKRLAQRIALQREQLRLRQSEQASVNPTDRGDKNPPNPQDAGGNAALLEASLLTHKQRLVEVRERLAGLETRPILAPSSAGGCSKVRSDGRRRAKVSGTEAVTAVTSPHREANPESPSSTGMSFWSTRDTVHEQCGRCLHCICVCFV